MTSRTDRTRNHDQKRSASKGRVPVESVTELEDDGQPSPCDQCGSTEQVELHDERDGHEQSITVCAGCGAD